MMSLTLVLPDTRASKSALFFGYSGLEEGLRVSERPISDHDNDKATDSFQDRLTRDIHEEVERRNRMLDHMGHNVRIDSRRFLRKKQQADVQTGRIFCGFLFIRLLPHKVPRIFYAKLRI
ncbi:hypothetical protein MLD38_027279 [Melastoma candidum]|uniref:Uncharacterized protein n=1 Tax=Melastoma candidum TaxID=119954 RepID=A0ACB9P1A1_9MYRT|nr:hypothetical protein MLD38_027279 [Melastoma candidum]